jgi:hypothetical protein
MLDPQMDHLVCFVPGMLILGVEKVSAHKNTHTELAKQLMRTCYETYARQASGLSPEITRFDDRENDFKVHASHYILRPGINVLHFFLRKF